MSTIIIAILIIAVIVIQLSQVNRFNDDEKTEIYQWWHIPWEALLFATLMYFVYRWTHFPDWPLINRMVEEYEVEAVYALICHVLWYGLHMFLRASSVHHSLIGFYRKVFAQKRPDKETALPFPYFIDDEKVVRARVGQVFYRWTLKATILLAAIVYAVYFALVYFTHVEFYLISAFGLLGLLPLIEYYVYLCAEVPVESETVSTVKSEKSDFDELWKIFVKNFDNYAVAWKRTNNESDSERVKIQRVHNEKEFEKLMVKFKDSNADVFVENCDLATAFIKLEPFIDLVEKNGRHVLIALEIPNHFSVNDDKSYTDEIADRLADLLKKNFHVYDEKSTKESLHESIVVSSLSLISRQGLDYEWMSKIGLVVVVNIFDKGVSNLYEDRRFCYLLQSVNETFQLLFVTPLRRGTEPSMKNTWLTGKTTFEGPMAQFPQGDKQYFIGYNYEEYDKRFKKILIKDPNEPVYSGSEMALIALSCKYAQENKAVTPVHYLELAYTNAIEGPEELDKLVIDAVDRNQIEVSVDDLHRNVKTHLLPVEQIVEDQVFSVVFDQECNAPAVYRKWRHLGLHENFTIVVSKPYLFRDYFNANHVFFTRVPFMALEPQLCKSRITVAIILLNMLKDAAGGMEETELRELFNGYYSQREIKSVPMIIKSLLADYFSADLANMLIAKDVVDFDGSEYHHHTAFRLELADKVDLSYLDMVKVIDESGNVLFDILYDLMYQSYCKGQMHSFSGKPYIIGDYDKKTRTLKVRSRNINDREIIFYKPSLKVVLSGKKRAIKDMEGTMYKWNHKVSGQELWVGIEGFETNVRIITEEMYSFTSYHMGGSHNSNNCPPIRQYNKGKALKVTFGFLQKPEYLERINDIRESIQILLYEAMQSVFPHHSQYLIVASEGQVDQTCKELPWIFNRFSVQYESEGKETNSTEANDNGKASTLSYYFIEDAHVDLGLIGALCDKDNIWYIFRYIYDYLIWLTEGSSVVPDGYDSYLYRKDFDKFAFLKYGESQLPSCFDVDLLINFIRDFFEKRDELQDFVTKRQSQQDVYGTCDFCRREMKNSEMQRLSDGRMRCPDCSEEAIDTDEQFIKICDDAKELFKTHLGIDFGDIKYEAKLVSAVELHRLNGSEFSITNGYDIRKLVGLAMNRSMDVFYVEDGYKPGKTLGIIAHEMTHIWEYSNDDFQKIKATNEDWVEGLAVWTDLYLSEKAGVATMEERKGGWLACDDEYGRGLKLILDLCPDDPYGYIRQKGGELR